MVDVSTKPLLPQTTALPPTADIAGATFVLTVTTNAFDKTVQAPFVTIAL